MNTKQSQSISQNSVALIRENARDYFSSKNRKRCLFHTFKFIPKLKLPYQPGINDALKLRNIWLWFYAFLLYKCIWMLDGKGRCVSCLLMERGDWSVGREDAPMWQNTESLSRRKELIARNRGWWTALFRTLCLILPLQMDPVASWDTQSSTWGYPIHSGS